MENNNQTKMFHVNGAEVTAVFTEEENPAILRKVKEILLNCARPEQIRKDDSGVA